MAAPGDRTAGSATRGARSAARMFSSGAWGLVFAPPPQCPDQPYGWRAGGLAGWRSAQRHHNALSTLRSPRKPETALKENSPASRQESPAIHASSRFSRYSRDLYQGRLAGSMKNRSGGHRLPSGVRQWHVLSRKSLSVVNVGIFRDFFGIRTTLPAVAGLQFWWCKLFCCRCDPGKRSPSGVSLPCPGLYSRPGRHRNGDFGNPQPGGGRLQLREHVHLHLQHARAVRRQRGS